MCFGVGLVVFARMIPANSPDASIAEIVNFYTDNALGIRIGMVLVMFGSGLFIPWGVSLATQTRRAAPQHPVLFHIQVACSVGACMLGVMVCLAGGLAAFRAGQISGDITQMLNDIVWFCWVFPGSYFEVWCAVVGVSVLLDKGTVPVFPRWFGYLSIWAAISYVPGLFAVFFKHGVLSYNGIFVWWIPTVVFFAWILPAAYYTIQAIRSEPEEPSRVLDPAIAREFASLRAEIARKAPTGG
jgi:hypothetical protein